MKHITAMAAAGLLALGAAACTPAEEERAEAEAAETGNELQEEAAQVGAACKTCHTKYREAD